MDDDEPEDDPRDLDLDHHAEWCKDNPLERALEEEAKRPAGRPPVTGVTRSTPILVRLTPDERAHMQRAADAAGQPLAAWVRDVAVRAAR